MRLFCAMLLQQRHAKTFAGKIVSEMIRMGADAALMRSHKIPQGVFYWTLGSQAWIERNPQQCAEYCCRQMRRDFLFKANKPDEGREAAAAKRTSQSDGSDWPGQCPHCGDELLTSEDRGLHCDGCDDLTADDIEAILAKFTSPNGAIDRRSGG